MELQRVNFEQARDLIDLGFVHFELPAIQLALRWLLEKYDLYAWVERVWGYQEKKYINGYQGNFVFPWKLHIQARTVWHPKDKYDAIESFVLTHALENLKEYLHDNKLC